MIPSGAVAPMGNFRSKIFKKMRVGHREARPTVVKVWNNR